MGKLKEEGKVKVFELSVKLHCSEVTDSNISSKYIDEAKSRGV